jgi:hypothetical protein
MSLEFGKAYWLQNQHVLPLRRFKFNTMKPLRIIAFAPEHGTKSGSGYFTHLDYPSVVGKQLSII